MPSYPLSYPTNPYLTPKKIDFTAKTIATRYQSPYTGKQQVYRYGGQYWELNLTIPPLLQSDAEELTGFLAALAGTSGTFTFKLPTKLVITSSQSITVGANGNDFTGGSGVQIGKYGYCATSPYRLVKFTTSSSLFPKLPAGSVTINNSTGVLLRLATNDIQYSTDEMMITNTVIPCIEVL